MAMLTLGEAARLTGRGKTTLARAIKGGRLSATRMGMGNYSIDPAELARWRPFPAHSELKNATAAATGSGAANLATPDDTGAALAGIAMLRLLDDMRTDRDHWRAMAQRLPITDQRAQPWWSCRIPDRRFSGGARFGLPEEHR